jgi:hypothetical protein
MGEGLPCGSYVRKKMSFLLFDTLFINKTYQATSGALIARVPKKTAPERATPKIPMIG